MRRGIDASPVNILATVIARIGASAGGDAHFSASEVAQWPLDAVKALKDACLLAPASPADSTECPGCEQSCFMPVHVVPGAGPLPPRAFIACEYRDDIGRVIVPIASLERVKSSGRMLAEAVTALLNIQPGQPALIDGQRWRLGMFKGAKHKAAIGLSLGIEPQIEAGGHQLRLAELLAFRDGGGLTIDLATVRRCVDSPTGGTSDGHEQPAERAARYRKRMKELQASGVTAYRKQLAAEEGIDPSRIGQLLRDYPEAQVSANTWFPGSAPPRKAPPSARGKKQRQRGLQGSD